MNESSLNNDSDELSLATSGAVARPKSHLKVAGKMLGVACAMFGFGYLMVPMYNIICDITGLNGKTGRVSAESVADNSSSKTREVIVEFDTSINQSGAWIFKPMVKSMTVQTGKLYTASYFAQNLSDNYVVARQHPV